MHSTYTINTITTLGQESYETLYWLSTTRLSCVPPTPMGSYRMIDGFHSYTEGHDTFTDLLNSVMSITNLIYNTSSYNHDNICFLSIHTPFHKQAHTNKATWELACTNRLKATVCYRLAPSFGQTSKVNINHSSHMMTVVLHYMTLNASIQHIREVQFKGDKRDKKTTGLN